MQYQLRAEERFNHVTGFREQIYSLWYMKRYFGFSVWRPFTNRTINGKKTQVTGDRMWARRISEEFNIPIPGSGGIF